MRKPKASIRILTIKQVGAQPIKTSRDTFYKLGGGIFREKQILASRQRFARFGPLKTKKIKKSSFGL